MISVVGALNGSDTKCELIGHMIKRGKHLAFFESKVMCDGKITALSKTTKAIINSLPITHSTDPTLNITQSKL